jgi:2-polyprenyl-3-methyl-5-hydroxy-6-metoxy-1,4-benzoquinol methylase
MKIFFLNGINAWKDFQKGVYQHIIENRFNNIAEIGGGANPLLALDFIAEQKLNYHIIDISEEELSKADARYTKVISDLESKDLEISFQYEFIFSQLTVEHIKDIKTFYANIYKLLKPGGFAYFFFACKTTLPTISNYLLPELISEKILLFIQPFRKNEKHGKFKAHYKWCFGPTKKNINRFENMNLEIVSYTGYFGHSYYQRVSLLNFLEKIKTKILLKHPNPYFCSYSHVLLKKK